MRSEQQPPLGRPDDREAPLIRVGYCHRCGRPRLRNADPCPACGAAFIADPDDLVAEGEAGRDEPVEPAEHARRGVRAWLSPRRIAGAALLLAAGVVLAVTGYQAGRADLLGPILAANSTPRALQIGTEAPGQSFAVRVDNLSTSVTQPRGAPAPNAECPNAAFSEDFERGDLPEWATTRTVGDGLADVRPDAANGTSVARLAASGAPGSFAYVRFGLCEGRALDATADVLVEAEGAPGANVPLFRVFSADGRRLLSLYRQNAAGDRLFIQVGDDYAQTFGRLPLGSWANVSLHVSYPEGEIHNIELIVDGDMVYSSSR